MVATNAGLADHYMAVDNFVVWFCNTMVMYVKPHYKIIYIITIMERHTKHERGFGGPYVPRPAAWRGGRRLGFGRITVSEIEAPNLLESLV